MSRNFSHIVSELRQGEPATIRFYGKITEESASRFNGEFREGLIHIKSGIDNVTASDAETVAGGQCIVSGNTQLPNGATVEVALYAMWKKCPKQIRKKAGLSFIIGWDAWDAYDQYISDKQVKYSENTEVKGRRSTERYTGNG